DKLPNDAGHFIAVEFDDGVVDFDLLHAGLLEFQDLGGREMSVCVSHLQRAILGLVHHCGKQTC
ncbi:MAG: hypothetical protein ACPHQT_03125, partial [Planctomycetota bacterium]